MPVGPAYRPDPRADGLPQSLYAVVWPAAFPQHIPRLWDRRAAASVGLASLDETEWCRHFAGFAPLPDNLAQPLALAYHGHQFRVYNPDIGDGRGFLYAQLRERGTDRLLDLGTKGSGRTPFSRDADGRLTLKGAVREALASAQLAALGVPTSRCLAAIETGEALYRHDEPAPARSAVLTRLGHSHIRVGTFQRLAFNRDDDGLAALLDYCVSQFVPAAEGRDTAGKALALLDHAVAANARLAARWMLAGFVHGVLNTDNININGESFDYGPWRFLPAFDRGFTAAYFDDLGLYAYGRQPTSVKWALARLAECFLPWADREAAVAAVERFEGVYHQAMAEVALERLNLAPRGGEADRYLASDLLDFLEASGAGFERVFFDLYAGPGRDARLARSPQRHLYAGEAYDRLAARLAQHAVAEPERARTTYFQGDGPNTLLIEEVEALWTAIYERDDWGPLAAKLAALEAQEADLQDRLPESS